MPYIFEIVGYEDGKRLVYGKTRHYSVAEQMLEQIQTDECEDAEIEQVSTRERRKKVLSTIATGEF